MADSRTPEEARRLAKLVLGDGHREAGGGLEELGGVLHDIRDFMQQAVEHLDDISRKLNNLDGIHNLDDVVAAVEEATSSLCGYGAASLPSSQGAMGRLPANLEPSYIL